MREQKAYWRLAMALALGGVALWGADFWEKTKFPDWSDKEVRKMLNDSPWAKPVAMHLGSGGRGMSSGSGKGGGRRGGAMSAGGLDASESGISGGGARGVGRGGGGFDDVQSPPSTMLTVRWHSALPIKQAIARLRYGSEAANSAEAQKMTARPATQYIVGISGVPMQALRGNPAQLKSKALLKVKGKEPVAAQDIQADREERSANLYLFFPRTSEITLEDQEVEVSLELANQEIRRKFKLKDMVYAGKLEI